MAREWINFVSTLSESKKRRVTKHVFRDDCTIKSEFPDASLSTYRAAIIVQSLPVEKLLTAHLLCSKSEVLSTKTLSIPRLEL